LVKTIRTNNKDFGNDTENLLSPTSACKVRSIDVVFFTFLQFIQNYTHTHTHTHTHTQRFDYSVRRLDYFGSVKGSLSLFIRI